MLIGSLLVLAIQDVLGGKGREIQQAWLESMVRAAAARPAPETMEEAEERKLEGRADLLRGLGLEPMLTSTPLNAQVTGVLKRDGYRIEQVTFQSRPEFYVTAHLYVPDGPGPFPVILNPHGHWGWKKTEPVVQARLIAQVKRGYLAMVVDSPGNSFEGGRPVERRQQGSHHDFRLAMASGTATGVYVWDLMRALDYLENRKEADMSRVGITGASGGGTATTYAFAADPRIDCAVPVVYATSLEVNPHNGCECNHVPGTLRIGDRADVLALRAPAPVLVIGAREDAEFPPEGTRRTGEKLRAIWSLYGKEDDARWLLFDGPHDYGRAMREAMIGFFDLHLRGVGDGSPVKEPELSTEPPDAAELVVLPEWPKDARTMLDFAAKELLRKGQPRTPDLRWQQAWPARGELKFETMREEEGVRWLRIHAEGMMDLPAVLRMPAAAPRAMLVIFSDGGKVGAAERFDAAALTRGGFATLCVDVPGTGELSEFDLRLAHYLGCGPTTVSAWHLRALLEALRKPDAPAAGAPLGLLSEGPFASVVLAEACDGVQVDWACSLDALKSWNDLHEREATPLAVLPLAMNNERLEDVRLRAKQPTVLHLRGTLPPDWRPALVKRF
jgi:dienelactone hydrolase